MENQYLLTLIDVGIFTKVEVGSFSCYLKGFNKHRKQDVMFLFLEND